MHATSDPRRRALLLSAVLGLCPLALCAQGATRIWRCGNQYSDQPCAAGTEVAPIAAPSQEARAEADAATRRARQQGDAMARERERSEAAAAGRAPGVFQHRSPWDPDDDEDASRSRKKGAKRPRTHKGRSPQSDGFTAKGAARSKSSSSR